MRFYSLNFNANSEVEQGWRLSHKENGSEFSSLMCTLDGRPLFISTTKKLQEEIEKGYDQSQLDIVPLYNKTLVDVHGEDNKRQSIMVYLSADDGKFISSIKFTGCATAAQRASKDRKKAAFAVVTTQADFSIRMFQNDGQIITIDKNGTVVRTVNDRELTTPTKIRFRKIMVLPRKAYFDKDLTGDISSIEGFQAVNIIHALSNHYIVINRPETVEYSPNLSTVDRDAVTEMLSNVGKPAMRKVTIRRRK